MWLVMSIIEEKWKEDITVTSLSQNSKNSWGVTVRLRKASRSGILDSNEKKKNTISSDLTKN